MINTKSFHVIDKSHVKGNIHVVGVGALGSRIVENLVRLNLASKIIVYDMDVVEEKNLNNQSYLRKHIGMPKVNAIKDLSSMIDDSSAIRGRNKEVEYIRNRTNDVIVLAIDNFHARGKILSSLVRNPLVIAGGINSFGGNIEVVRGKEGVQRLSEEYLQMESGIEYAPEDLTPCGSPISIYHRIGTASGIASEAIIKYINSKEDIQENYVFSVSDYLFLKS